MNGRFLSQPLTGVQRFALETVNAIDGMISGQTELLNEFRFVVLAPRDAVLPGHLRHIAVRSVGSLVGHPWDQLELAYHARGELLLSLCGAGPVLHSKHVAVLHDAAVFANPGNFSRPYRSFHRTLAPMLMRNARAVVTVSRFSQEELARYCHGLDNKLRVVPNGADHILGEPADLSVLAANDLARGQYILALGSLSPNKNIGLAGAALAKLDDLGLRLVVAGGRSTRVFSHCALESALRVAALGYVPNAVLRALYENALCFVFPSYYEGFGIPPLEAMLCGCPVVVSDIPALRETCGDAALYCNPRDPGSLAAQILALAGNPALRG
ncbi:MAG: glycosyltransferase family 4 protein, partial [Nitrospira sp.]